MSDAQVEEMLLSSMIANSTTTSLNEQTTTMNEQAEQQSTTPEEIQQEAITASEIQAVPLKPATPTLSADHRELFPDTTQDFAMGMKFVPRHQFNKKFDVGYALDQATPNNQDVILLYQSEAALPNDNTDDSIDAAIENCDTMQVVYVNQKPQGGRKGKKPPHKQCIAIMGQWESRHVHKFQRNMAGMHGKDFQYEKDHHQELPPTKELRKASQQALLLYLSVVDDALEELKPLAAQTALGLDGQPGPIIVMVANSGQATLFVNFVCTARARGLDISRILLFAIDRKMHDMAQALGIHVFFDERIFGSIPKEAAVDYHDLNYGQIMMSKVYCVHMVNALGYDLLFQDVDAVWYQNPLDYFKTMVDPDFDMYFQHDGIHHPFRNKPLAANTGVYFVRHNARTEYFFSVFVRMGEMVLLDKSHQAALTTLVNEHSMLWGLRVKILAEDHLLFLSGYHYHAERHIIKQMKEGKHQPILYHVHWMNTNMKRPALIGSNNWYVNDAWCGLENNNSITAHPAVAADQFFDQCCRATPQPFKGG